MSKQDFIYCEKGALSKETCNKLINFFDKNINMGSPGIMGNMGYLDNLEITLDTGNSGELYESLAKGLHNYKKRYPLIGDFIGPWRLDNLCQLMRYNPDSYYDRIHCENDCYKRPAVQRCFAWMFYLNNIRRGGGTEFIHQRVTAKPREGDLYIWPAGWTHMHRGVNAPKEVKYIITGWCNFYDV